MKTTATETRSLLANVWTHLNDELAARGEGIYLYDNVGNRFIDFTSGIGVTSTGHCHPKVVQAIQEQAATLIFSQINCMPGEGAAELAGELLPLAPDGIDRFFFANSGAEAIEGAVKLARVASGKSNIIAFQGGFHGRTHLAMALTASKTVYRAGFQPLPSGVFFAPFPYPQQLGMDGDEATDFCLEQLELLLHSQSAASETAAMLLEPVLGEGGYVPAPDRFLQGLRGLCDQHEILLILDEIQTGFGRTGDWWAHTRSGIRPDILVLAKGIASGMPVAVIAAPQALMERLPAGSHGGTYGGGNAVAMAAAIATIRTIRDEGLVDNARMMGSHLIAELRELQDSHPMIGDVRGRGLMIATEFQRQGEPSDEAAVRVSRACLQRGLMLLTCGTYNNTVRWIPPLIVQQQQLDEALSIFAEALDQL